MIALAANLSVARGGVTVLSNLTFSVGAGQALVLRGPNGIVARLRRRNVEIAFLCGLLHDLGKAATPMTPCPNAISAPMPDAS